MSSITQLRRERIPVLTSLLPGQVDIWRMQLDLNECGIQALWKVLSEQERSRALRLRDHNLQRRFIAAHAGLRRILARYIAKQPQEMEFGWGNHGKPYLIQEPNTPPFYFNLSHSQDLMLLAVSRTCDLGLDLEAVRPMPEMDGMVNDYFSETERASFFRLHASLREKAFFQAWTLKEAYMKGRGTGFSLPFNRFSVAFGPGEAAALLSADDDPAAASRWRLLQLAPADGFTGALALPAGFTPRLFYKNLKWEPSFRPAAEAAVRPAYTEILQIWSEFVYSDSF